MLKKASYFIALIAIVVITVSRNTYRTEGRSFSGPTMGTRYNIRFVERVGSQDKAVDIAALQQQVDERLAAINRMMSTYDPQSELSLFNVAPTDEWFAVSPETAQVVSFALEVAQKTDGAFDPTIGPAVNLWGFGPSKTRSIPTQEQIDSALLNVNYQQVEARITPPALRKHNPNLYVDLSAIAKGFAADEISRLLANLGYDQSMVEIGGEIRTRGVRPDGSAWRIGVENPSPDGGTIKPVLELRNESLASSGDYRNFFEHEGVRYSHTINPKTGRPVTHQVATVSVRAKTCMEADALATALLVMGEKGGYDWCVAQEAAALFLIRQDTKIIKKATPMFSAMMER